MNLLDRFKESVVGSDGKIADYTSTISSKGDFTRIDDINVIIKSWTNLLLTPVETFIDDPNYGSNLKKYLFDPMDDLTEERIIEEIRYRTQLYDDRARIENIQVLWFKNSKSFEVNIDIEYEGEKTTITVVVDEELYQ